MSRRRSGPRSTSGRLTPGPLAPADRVAVGNGPEVPVLPAAHRLRTRTDFTEVVRGGTRSSRPLLTVHLLVPAAPSTPAAGGETVLHAQPRAGLVVSKAVGGSVVRHRTSRRLRHLLATRVGALPPSSRVVVRAAPAAGAADSAALGTDLDEALAAALRRAARPAGGAR